MTDRELLQQVLDAWQDHWVNDNQSALLEMIRANCANCARCGEKNPAEIHTCTPKSEEGCAECGKKSSDGWALYCVKCSEREWQGLTDDEIKEIVGGWKALPIAGYTRKLFDQIEAKLKEKNCG